MEAKHRMVFTEDRVRSLPMKSKPYRAWDGGNGRGTHDVARGLCVFVTPTGTRSYRSTYYFPGSSVAHQRHLGRVGELALEDARAQCRRDRADALKGINPKNSSGSDKFEDVVKEYVRRYQGKNKSAAQVERMLLRDCAEWALRPIGSIKGPEIQAHLEFIRDGDDDNKARPGVANVLYARLNTFFTWCVGPSVAKIATDPMQGIKRPAATEPNKRPWYKGKAADEAIVALWHGAAKLDPVLSRWLKACIVLGKRKTQLAEMRWEEIDDAWVWSPSASTHNKRQHTIPLPVLVQPILHPRKKAGFVFPGDKDGRLWIENHKLDEMIRKASGFDGFHPHGLRHVAENKCAELKVPENIRDLMFDHVSGRGSGKIYDHHDYLDEMLKAYERFAKHIEGLVAPAGNVAVLR